ncbi:unnamed protein product [Arabis nemorensis]|uniref:ADP-ribosyl cyclase/cyclic ADP-ribose hydrolase n=1 Tax=Arabis nemorensis TaxID=586526 RepID=A0A565C8T4_9BRAS|nr:unnamed protein product [Arabis nemorensis]
MATSSSSSSVESQPQHQVFINFRGKQLRYGFVSHLVKDLEGDGINVFIDEHETRGNDLNVLFDRIEESKIAIAIFSSMYTESDWCLDELDKIMECVDSRTLVVIPVFFKVEAEDVRNQTGVFGDNFEKLAKDHSDKIDKWEKALNRVPEKMGYVLNETSKESEYVLKLVENVKKQLTRISTELEGEGDERASSLFGIEPRIKQFEEMFDSACGRTLTIGVVGMPGIGKTTLTKKLYERFEDKFARTAFLPDVREMCRNGTMERSILTRELLRKEDVIQQVSYMTPEVLNKHLLDKKCLVVLDNVSDKKQIEVLLGKCDWITEGSLIIITTSDRLAIEGKVDDTYEVSRLSGRDSLRYFSYYAFSGHICNMEGNFMNLCKEFVDYAKGNPFVLKILGRELQGKNNTHWEKTLRKLAQSPSKTIKGALQLIYDELALDQQNVFLDVACFFRSGDEYYVRCLVESCENEPIDAASEIQDLASKFLINISGGRVEMHDLLYTFGQELGSQGQKLGSQGQCRVWNHKGLDAALKNTAGADSVRGIFLDMSELKKELLLDRCTFTRMHNLRYLKFYDSRCHRECEADYKLNIPDGLEFLALDEIRYLYWLKFPEKNLPEDFNPKNLTDLSLPYSKIEEVWVGVKNTPKLKWVDLSYSSKLCNLSGLLNAESLQRLSLEGCTSLQVLPKNMKRMKSLVLLNMRGCASLLVFPSINLRSLKTLILTNCSSLQDFRVTADNLETLHLDGTAIVQLPTNMGKLQRLIVLNLKDCTKLVAVPECLEKLKALQELVLSGCSKLKTFPITIENMKCLKILLLDGTKITDMPQILQFNSSKVEDLCSLRRLCLSGNDKISSLQIFISQLHQLKFLDLKHCRNLISIPLLPPNLEILDAHGCEKLKTVASPMAVLKLVEQVKTKFIFTNCNSLEEAAKNSITSYAQRKSQLDAVRCYKEKNVSEPSLITSFPGSEVPSWFNNRGIGSKLNLEFPPHWCENRLSTIVLCAIVSTEDEINHCSIECTFEFKNESETDIRFSYIFGGGWIEPRKIDSEHVFICYTSSSDITKHLEGSSLHLRDHQKCVPPEASIEFKVRDGTGDIVNCGFSLVYEEANHNHVVIEENYNETSQTRDFPVGERMLSIAGVVFLLYGFARFFIK